MMEHLQGRGYVADGDSAAPKDPPSSSEAAASEAAAAAEAAAASFSVAPGVGNNAFAEEGMENPPPPRA